jgi:hypothetical protein
VRLPAAEAAKAPPGAFAVSVRASARIAVLLTLAAGAAVAQTDDVPPIPWAYSAFFGTGVYEVSGGEETYAIRFAPGWRLREASLDEHGNREIGIKLKFPVSLSLQELDPAAIGATLAFDNVSTITLVPGVEIDVPLGPRWSLKPFAYVGWGTDTDLDASAWIYWTGIKSRIRFPADKLDWALVSSLTYAGYSDNNGEHSAVLPLLTAVELDRPLESKRIQGETVHLHWHLGYTEYLNEVELFRSNLREIDVENEWELGMAFSKGAEPLRLWRLRWDRVGISYRFSSDREFRGIGLFFSSLFDR